MVLICRVFVFFCFGVLFGYFLGFTFVPPPPQITLDRLPIVSLPPDAARLHWINLVTNLGPFGRFMTKVGWIQLLEGCLTRSKAKNDNNSLILHIGVISFVSDNQDMGPAAGQMMAVLLPHLPSLLPSVFSL